MSWAELEWPELSPQFPKPRPGVPPERPQAPEDIGARVAALAGPSEVLVSGTVKDLVAGAGFEFEDRGTHALKGITGDWHLYAVSSGPPPVDGAIVS